MILFRLLLIRRIIVSFNSPNDPWNYSRHGEPMNQGWKAMTSKSGKFDHLCSAM